MRAIWLALAIACGTPPVERKPPPPPPPATETPAAHMLRVVLDAFDSHDDAPLVALVARHHLDARPAELKWLRKRSGGFALISTDHGSRSSLRFRVKERATGDLATGWISVAGETITYFDLLDDDAGVPLDKIDIAIDAAARTRVLDQVAAAVTALFYDRDKVAAIAKAMRADHAAITEGPALAARLTEELRAIGGDRRFQVDFLLALAPTEPVQPKRRADCGFRKVERLGKVGYLEIIDFYDTATCARAAAAAMAALGEIDALIIDLRDNGGSTSPMVAIVASYLFAQRIHLDDVDDRRANATTENWTDPALARYVTQPVYVLTSRYTFAGAEELAYNLRQLGRAKIVGETTKGGTHPIVTKPLAEHFTITVPYARTINAITRTDWGNGVVPDVEVAADQALGTAKDLATRRN